MTTRRAHPFTHQHGEHKLRYGHPVPFGVSLVPGGVNFSIYSGHATDCTLVLFEKGADKPFVEIPFPPEFRIGHIWAMIVFDLDHTQIEYGYRFGGPNGKKSGHRYDRSFILLDPFARAIGGRDVWMMPHENSGVFPLRARVCDEDFDWDHDRPLRVPATDLVIYEMHVRGFTRHPTSGVKNPGTFDGIREKIPYLKSIGVNCVELLPIFEFDECENTRTNPLTGEPLCNYWGYSTVGFNAAKAGYAAAGKVGGQADEFKQLVKDLHAADLQVVLDVVFNHTAEGGEDGPTLSFRGIDNRVFYMLLPDGSYANYTGCGNTVNCNHPVVRTFIRNALAYWASEFHVDGFRFDLASVMARDSDGTPLADPPLIEELAHAPILANCHLIAEAWDAGGLYQVGHFPDYGRWMEWNGKYRDAARRFLKGDPGVSGEMVQRILGSPDLYKAAGRKPTASVNFITCHDGFTLRDLYSYNEKHNLENGESNRDGADYNASWNCGVEGETDDPDVNALRLRMQKNALTLLFLSQGVPMVTMGDECGRTQRGNNNAYCHDEPWNWLDWSQTEKDAGILRFHRGIAAFRVSQPALRRSEFLTGTDCVGSGYPDISWHGVKPWKPDWTPTSCSIAFLLCGRHGKATGGTPNFIYAAFNMFHEPLIFDLPVLPKGMAWFRAIDTALPEPDDIVTPGEEPRLPVQTALHVTERSVAVLIGK
ncbi:MAG: glycogen debranching protein [Chthoniobacterales bacterium]